ncbi:MAG: hypothetical protein VX044_04180 [Planctomycetota bacterium]|nr:hypothetical protein [Planctomycetota bacterium]
MTARLRARAHSALGWIAYQLGWSGTARRQYERVLVLRGSDFRAYVGLGRIAFDAGDYAGWRRDFECARRTDPIRFARLRHPLELFEPRLAGTLLDRRFRAQPEEELRAEDAAESWSETAPTSDADAALSGDADHALDAKTRDVCEEKHAHTPDDQPRAHIPRPSPPDASVTHDDFSSPAERRRFQLRRPINRREIARCDLADLARRLSG